MINQRGILRAPEFVLPRTTDQSSRAVNYHRERIWTSEKVWLEIPMFYKKVVVCVTALVLGTGVGVMIPLVTQALERWQYF